MRFVSGVRPLDALLGSLRGCLDRFPDKRRGLNTTYPMGDIGLAAFAVFFTCIVGSRKPRCATLQQP
jgi:hypothetical protein